MEFSMTPRERVLLALQGERTDRPLFCPAVYEHKAKLIDSSPCDAARSVELLVNAVLAEYKIYQPDLLTVGIDIYNIEAEALGCNVLFSDAVDAVPVIDHKLFAGVEDVNKLSNVDPDPEQDGRMPLMLEAAEIVHNKIGSEIIVRGSISGPYSIATELVGIEALMMACILQPEDVTKLLDFCTQTAIDYGKAFLARGLEVCIFDSQTAPPLMSPDIYAQLVLPHVQRLIKTLKNAGAEFIEYVVGGDTSANVDNLFAAGADVLLADFTADIDVFLKRAKDNQCLVRHNISPILIECGDKQTLIDKCKEVAQLAVNNPRVIVGTGVLSYNTPGERILRVRRACMEEFHTSDE